MGDAPAQLDPTGYLDDPDAELARCAAAHWWAEGLDAHVRPTPLVLSWAPVRDVLADRRLSPRCFTDDMVANGLSPETADQLTPLFGRHGEAHRAFRALLSAAFTPRSVERLRPVAADVAARLADGIVAAGGRCEVVAAFAEPLPPEVFAALFGLPAEDRDRLARWAAAIAPAFFPAMTDEQVAGVEAAAAELRAYARHHIAQRRAEPADDLVTRLLEAEVDGERLSEDDVVAMVSGFIFAGAETTRRQLTAAVQVLAECPHAWEAMADDPGRIPATVEEVLRHRPIVPGLSRVAEVPFERGDLDRAPGDRLLASFLAANHDPERFPDPQRFDPDREDAAAHVTFGWGPHFCVGAGLARMELQEGLRALIARFGPPVVEATGEATGLTAPDELRVRFPLRVPGTGPAATTTRRADG